MSHRALARLLAPLSMSVGLLRVALGRSVGVALAAAALLAPFACDAGGPAGGIYVGEVNGVMLAVVAADDLVTAYACDGNVDYLGVHAWFHGQLTDGAGTLTNADGAKLVLDVDGDSFTATLSGDTITPGPQSFHGAAVSDDAAGLYWGAADGWVGGWIVDETGEQRGAAFRHETDDASLASIDPSQSSVVLDDQVDRPVLPLARMTTPEVVK